MKKRLLYSLAMALFFGVASRAVAQETAPKPVVVVSVTSVDKLLANAKTLGDIAGAGEQVQMFLGMSQMLINGVDTTKPCGAVMSMAGLIPGGYAFIPVTDFNAVMQTAKAADAGNGIYQLDQGQTTAFIKEHNGWAFVSNAAEALANLPDDPSTLLAGQEKEYDIAIRVFVKNIPEVYREMAVNGLQAGLEQAGQTEFESDEEFSVRKKVGKATIKQIVSLINDTENVAIGWSVDEKARTTFFDFNWTATEGSKTAAQFAALEDSTSDFTGFLQPDAAMTFNMVSPVSSEDAAQVLASLKVAREQALRAVDLEEDLDGDKETVKSVVGDLMDILASTIEGGKIDLAAALVLRPEAVTFAAGGKVADGAKVEAALKKLAKVAEKEPDFPGIHFDAGGHKGVRFHTMSVPLDDVDEDARRVIGEKLDVAFGFGKESVYMAAGKDAVQILKDAIDKSTADAGKSVPPAQVTFAVGPIVKFAASADPNNPMLGMIAAEMEKHKGKDRIRIVLRPIDNGVSYRLEIEEGVLGLAGQGAKMFGQMRRPAPAGF